MTVQPMFGLRQLIEESIGKPGLASTHRTHIARAVIVLAAGGGSRAVTHSAVDRHLGLPKGSTSYYCRTRAELVKPSIDLMRATSRASFIDFMSTAGPSITEVTRDYVLYLTTSRSCEVRARLACRRTRPREPARYVLLPQLGTRILHVCGMRETRARWPPDLPTSLKVSSCRQSSTPNNLLARMSHHHHQHVSAGRRHRLLSTGPLGTSAQLLLHPHHRQRRCIVESRGHVRSSHAER